MTERPHRPTTPLPKPSSSRNGETVTRRERRPLNAVPVGSADAGVRGSGDQGVTTTRRGVPVGVRRAPLRGSGESSPQGVGGHVSRGSGGDRGGPSGGTRPHVRPTSGGDQGATTSPSPARQGGGLGGAAEREGDLPSGGQSATPSQGGRGDTTSSVPGKSTPSRGKKKSSGKGKRKRKNNYPVVPSDRDIFILRYLYEFEMATKHHVKRALDLSPDLWTEKGSIRNPEALGVAGVEANEQGLLPPSLNAVGKVLMRMKRQGWLTSSPLGVKRGWAEGWMLSVTGARIIGEDFDRFNPHANHWRHVLGVAGLRNELEQSRKQSKGFFAQQVGGLAPDAVAYLSDHKISRQRRFPLVGQREEWKREIESGWDKGWYGSPESAFSDAHAYVTLMDAGRSQASSRRLSLIIPDLVVVRDGRMPIAIELERKAKEIPAYVERCKGYAESVFEEVFYFCSTPRLARRIETALVEAGYVQDQQTTRQLFRSQGYKPSKQGDGEWRQWTYQPTYGTGAPKRFHVIHLPNEIDRLGCEFGA